MPQFITRTGKGEGANPEQNTSATIAALTTQVVFIPTILSQFARVVLLRDIRSHPPQRKRQKTHCFPFTASLV